MTQRGPIRLPTIRVPQNAPHPCKTHMNDRQSQSDLAIHASPLKEVWTIAWPTVLTMTSYTVMQFTDAFMVAQLGPVHLTAQSNGGIWAFNAIAIAMGIVTVVNTYVSQNL